MSHNEPQCKCNECLCCYCIKKIISNIIEFLKSHFSGAVHFLVLTLLSIYVLSNWETCISMQFFSQFDGNNILFLVWIVLIFLLIYEVEGKGIKVAKRKQEEAQQNLINAALEYNLNSMSEQIKNPNLSLNDTNQNKEGGNKNGLSN